MVEALKNKFDLNVSKTTANKHLKDIAFTLKAVRYEPERAKTLENKEKRRDFVRKPLQYISEGKQICYMDETNFNLHISRIDGRSIRGSRATTISVGS